VGVAGEWDERENETNGAGACLEQSRRLFNALIFKSLCVPRKLNPCRAIAIAFEKSGAQPIMAGISNLGRQACTSYLSLPADTMNLPSRWRALLSNRMQSILPMVCCSFPLAAVVVLFASRYKAAQSELATMPVISALALSTTVPAIV
jgi:hypothetical protein